MGPDADDTDIANSRPGVRQRAEKDDDWLFREYRVLKTFWQGRNP